MREARNFSRICQKEAGDADVHYLLPNLCLSQCEEKNIKNGISPALPQFSLAQTENKDFPIKGRMKDVASRTVGQVGMEAAKLSHALYHLRQDGSLSDLCQ